MDNNPWDVDLTLLHCFKGIQKVQKDRRQVMRLSHLVACAADQRAQLRALELLHRPLKLEPEVMAICQWNIAVMALSGCREEHQYLNTIFPEVQSSFPTVCRVIANLKEGTLKPSREIPEWDDIDDVLLSRREWYLLEPFRRLDLDLQRHCRMGNGEQVKALLRLMSAQLNAVKSPTTQFLIGTKVAASLAGLGIQIMNMGVAEEVSLFVMGMLESTYNHVSMREHPALITVCFSRCLDVAGMAANMLPLPEKDAGVKRYAALVHNMGTCHDWYNRVFDGLRHHIMAGASLDDLTARYRGVERGKFIEEVHVFMKATDVAPAAHVDKEQKWKHFQRLHEVMRWIKKHPLLDRRHPAYLKMWAQHFEHAATLVKRDHLRKAAGHIRAALPGIQNMPLTVIFDQILSTDGA